MVLFLEFDTPTINYAFRIRLDFTVLYNLFWMIDFVRLIVYNLLMKAWWIFNPG